MKQLDLVLLGVVIVSCLALCKAQDTGESTDSARAKFQLSTVFDFAKYKQLFNKSYGSILEELARQKIFWGKFFRAVISRVKYRHEKADHYLSVNHLSDRTPDELDDMLVPADVMLGEMNAPLNEPTSEADDGYANLMVDKSTLEEVVDEIEDRKDEPGYKEIAGEIEKIEKESSKRLKRSLLSWRDDKLKGDFIEIPAHDDAGDPPVAHFIMEGSKDKDKWYHVKSGNQVKNFLHKAVDMVSSNNKDDKKFEYTYVKPMPEPVVSHSEPEKKKSGDHMKIDLRETKCLLPPKSQGSCGSCYAFVIIALYEFLYCKATGHLVSFSEQYLVDCGQRTGLRGCNGGSFANANSFVEQYGVELSTRYEYCATQRQCPYEDTTSRASMGYYKLSIPSNSSPGVVKSIMGDEFKENLSKTPISTAIAKLPDFQEYGGGVHQALECSTNKYHAMLVVGLGVEEGIEYYLLRNSYSTSWGERGYFKMSISGFKRCGVFSGLLPNHTFGYKSLTDKNPRYIPEFVNSRLLRDYN